MQNKIFLEFFFALFYKNAHILVYSRVYKISFYDVKFTYINNLKYLTIDFCNFEIHVVCIY